MATLNLSTAVIKQSDIVIQKLGDLHEIIKVTAHSFRCLQRSANELVLFALLAPRTFLSCPLSYLPLMTNKTYLLQTEHKGMHEFSQLNIFTFVLYILFYVKKIRINVQFLYLIYIFYIMLHVFLINQFKPRSETETNFRKLSVLLRILNK